VEASSGRPVQARRNVITADRGDKPATEQGDAAVAMKFDGYMNVLFDAPRGSTRPSPGSLSPMAAKVLAVVAVVK
jgi:hypothetical protein